MAPKLSVRLVNKKVRNVNRLFVLVSYTITHELVNEFQSPFQPSSYRNIRATLKNVAADGSYTLVLTAQKGKKTLRRTFRF